MNFDIGSLKENLSNLNKGIAPKKESPEWAEDIQSINNNTKNISDNTSLMKKKIDSLESTVVLLRLELDIERQRAEKAEKRNKFFDVIIAVGSGVFGWLLPVIIKLIKSLF